MKALEELQQITATDGSIPQTECLAFIASISISTTKHELFEIIRLVMDDPTATLQDQSQRTVSFVAKGMQIQTHSILLDSLRSSM